MAMPDTTLPMMPASKHRRQGAAPKSSAQNGRTPARPGTGNRLILCESFPRTHLRTCRHRRQPGASPALPPAGPSRAGELDPSGCRRQAAQPDAPREAGVQPPWGESTAGCWAAWGPASPRDGRLQFGGMGASFDRVSASVLGRTVHQT